MDKPNMSFYTAINKLKELNKTGDKKEIIETIEYWYDMLISAFWDKEHRIQYLESELREYVRLCENAEFGGQDSGKKIK